jgi:hypothetical protein
MQGHQGILDNVIQRLDLRRVAIIVHFIVKRNRMLYVRLEVDHKKLFIVQYMHRTFIIRFSVNNNIIH